MRLLINASCCFLLLLLACEKQAVVPISEPNLPIGQYVNFNSGSSTLNNLDFDGETFHFTSWEELEATAQLLREEVSSHNEAFQAPYTDLNDNAYNELITQLNFNELSPLDDFEESYGFFSKRRSLEGSLQDWMNTSTDEPDLSTFPDNFPITDPALRSLFNEQGAIRLAEELVIVADSPPTEAASPPCREERVIREMSIVQSGAGPIFVIETLGVVKLGLFNSRQRGFHATLLLSRGNGTPGFSPYRTRLRTEIEGTFRPRCQGGTPVTYRDRQGRFFLRNWNLSASFTKPYLPAPTFLIDTGCFVNGAANAPLFNTYHCL